jgi:hypothetical protein
MEAATRAALVAEYVAGPEVIRASLAGITDTELDARPAEGGWSAREVVHHTADSEMTSAIRLRRLIAEDDPLIVGYDGDEFARRLHYDERPIEPALAAIEGARATTAQILRGLTEAEVGEDRHPFRDGPVRRRAVARNLRRALPRARRSDPPGPSRDQVTVAPERRWPRCPLWSSLTHLGVRSLRSSRAPCPRRPAATNAVGVG